MAQVPNYAPEMSEAKGQDDFGIVETVNGAFLSLPTGENLLTQLGCPINTQG